MSAMIQNDVEKEWMSPLLDLRNALDFRSGDPDGGDSENTDRHLRDFRRMTGAVQVMSHGKPIPGPYTQASRETWLRSLLAAQGHIRRNGPSEVKDIELITLDELQEIRRIWVMDKHELEDRLPKIYQDVTGCAYPGRPLDDNLVLRESEMKVLSDLCGDDRLHYELTRELLSITGQQRSLGRRAGLFEQLEKTIRRHFYDDMGDAINRAKRIADERKRRGAALQVGASGFMAEPETLEYRE